MHSFRHRAKNRLRRAARTLSCETPSADGADGKKNSSRKHGNKHRKGYPIKVLRNAIDTIGM
jgi:hypothetical protein